MAKFKYHDNEDFVSYLQTCELPNPLWYLKRTFREGDFHRMAENTTWNVLSDPVGGVEPRRKYVFCQCKVCGFRRNVRIPDLRNNQTICEACLNSRLRKEADAAGCDLLGLSSVGMAYRRYRLRSC